MCLRVFLFQITANVEDFKKRERNSCVEMMKTPEKCWILLLVRREQLTIS